MLSGMKSFARIPAFVTTAFVAQCSFGQADAHEGHNYSATNTKWKTECGACHVAYPPRLLPADSWRAIMSGLDSHFGSDASLDTATNREITDFLVKNASTRKEKSSGKPQLRISETGWFKAEHRELAAHVWKNPKVKSPANCVACHAGAEQGDFSERHAKIPR